ncbi:MAG TPA: hypothetical protein VED59_04635, partial [Acidimicrobiales bacterium]|nr:hypothetical protein [Acidimicrobiales bacterium]
MAAVILAGAPTAAGFTRDYLYSVGQKSPEFAHSPAMSMLKAIGPAGAVVETDYRGSVAYFSGHRTAWTAFAATTPYGPFAAQNRGSCTLRVVVPALRADDASFLLVGDVNEPGLMDSPCLLGLAATPSTAKYLGAVRLLSTDHDQTSVFELLGSDGADAAVTDWTAGSPHGAARTTLSPNGSGDVGGTGYAASAVAGVASIEWSWSVPVPVNQVSVGSVTAAVPVGAVSILARSASGAWSEIASAAGPVGDGGVVPYLLARLTPGSDMLGLKVSVDLKGSPKATGKVLVSYVSAIGMVPTVPGRH